MPLLETRHVKATRKDRHCYDCEKPLPAGSRAVAMFGMAHEGEKPWWIYAHEKGECPNPGPFMQKVHAAAPRAHGEMEGGRRG